MIETTAAFAATEVLTQEDVAVEQRRVMDRIRNTANHALESMANVVEFVAEKAAPIILVGGLALTAAGCGRSDDTLKDDGKKPPTSELALKLCETGSWDRPTANLKNYNATAFLPRTMPGEGELDSPEEVPGYVANLFREPLGKKRDMAALAAVMVLAVDRATSGVGVNPDFDYLEAYRNKVDAYQAKGGEELAKADCARANEVLPQLTEFIGDFAEGGLTVGSFTAVRGDIQEGDKTIKGAIIDMHQEDYVPTKQMKGILIKFNSTAKDGDDYKVTDFNSVLISTDENGRIDGNFYVRGITLGKNGNAGAKLAPQLPPKFTIDNGTKNPTEVKFTDGGIEVTTINPSTGKPETKTIPCGSGGCKPGDNVEIPGIGVIKLPGVNPNHPGPTRPGVTVPETTTPNNGTTPVTVPGTVPVTTPGTTPTSLPPMTITTTTGVTVTTAPPTTHPAPTTTRPAPTTTGDKDRKECSNEIDVC